MILLTKFCMPLVATLVVATLAGLTPVHWARAAEHGTGDFVSARVAQPLKTAQQAIRKDNWSLALENIRKAQDVETRSIRDDYAIDTLLGYVFYKQNNYRAAAAVYERLLASPMMPASEASERMKAVAEMHFRIGDHDKAAYWAQSYLKNNSDDPEVLGLLGESRYRMGQFADAASVMQRAVAALENKKRKLPEAWLRVASNAYFKAGKDAQLEDTLLQLAAYYQRPADWGALLQRVAHGIDDDEVRFEHQLLMFDIGVLPDRDHEAAIFSALDHDRPADAERILEHGRKYFLPPQDRVGRYERIHAFVAAKQAANLSKLNQLTWQAEKNREAGNYLAIGNIYLSYEKYDEAIDALTSASRQSNSVDRDAARVSLGIAYFKLDRMQSAMRTFASVSPESKWRELADLWALRTGDMRSLENARKDASVAQRKVASQAAS